MGQPGISETSKILCACGGVLTTLAPSEVVVRSGGVARDVTCEDCGKVRRVLVASEGVAGAR